MIRGNSRFAQSLTLVLPVIGAWCAAGPARAASAYTPISPTMSDRTVTLDGHHLTIDEIVMVARHGAKVQLAADARQREADNYGLLLEASAEGIPVYWFNRGAGDQRETVMFDGDPTSPKNHALIAKTQSARFHAGALFGTGPEITDEEIVRAMMVVRANAMTFNAPSPQLAQMLLDLLNKRITPVVQSRGTLGEGDLAQLGNVGAAMVGAGEVYFQGTRMKADQALRSAGLTPIEPFAADDNALTSSNAYATGQAALLVHDAQEALEWADLIYAMNLDGMNSSITPLSAVVQRDRPEKWLNWHAARILDMIKGSYLFDKDAKRIIQDPESLRASSIRQGSTWEEWGALRDAVIFQANSSDHNPAVNVGLAPGDSWELATPQLMRFFVKGGALSHGQHGYIVSNANWDPYPMANRIESFVVALANMDIAVMLRIERLRNPFFTGVAARDVLPGVNGGFLDYAPVDLQQEIQSLMTPIAPFGSAIVGTVEDLQGQTRIKTQRARQAVDTTFDLLSFDIIEAGLWMDVRKAQDGARNFGAAPTAAWTALRQHVPLRPDHADSGQSLSTVATQFLKSTPASTFYHGEAPPIANYGATAEPAGARESLAP
jgi:histidine ammonia-lyase